MTITVQQIYKACADANSGRCPCRDDGLKPRGWMCGTVVIALQQQRDRQGPRLSVQTKGMKR